MRSTPTRYAGWVLLASLLSGTAVAAPYRPQDDTQVLERLGASATLRPGPTSSPDVAAQLARIHIERARRSGDPRELGYARGILQLWWNTDDAPDTVLLLRATVRQATHDFAGALADLDRLLQRRPQHVQALLTRATILRVQGRYAPALAACEALRGQAEPFVATLCLETLRSLSGELDAARRALDTLQPTLAAQSAGVAAWYRAERAEMAARAGDADAAEALYREAIARHPDDLDLRAAYADSLLDMGRASEVLDLIATDTPIDALRLRRALALHALRDPGFAPLDAVIRDGFAAAQRRGESLHLREEARYRLAVGDDPQQALDLARRNWKVQREPWDARVLLAAAAAAGDGQAVQTVHAWIAQTGFEDARLARDASP